MSSIQIAWARLTWTNHSDTDEYTVRWTCASPRAPPTLSHTDLKNLTRNVQKQSKKVFALLSIIMCKIHWYVWKNRFCLRPTFANVWKTELAEAYIHHKSRCLPSFHQLYCSLMAKFIYEWDNETCANEWNCVDTEFLERLLHEFEQASESPYINGNSKRFWQKLNKRNEIYIKNNKLDKCGNLNSHHNWKLGYKIQPYVLYHMILVKFPLPQYINEHSWEIISINKKSNNAIYVLTHTK